MFQKLASASVSTCCETAQMSMWPVCARPFFLFPSGETSPLMMTHYISWDMSTRMSLQCGEPFLKDCFTLLLVYQEKEARFPHKPNSRGAEGMSSFSSLTLEGQLRDVSRNAKARPDGCAGPHHSELDSGGSIQGSLSSASSLRIRTPKPGTSAFNLIS